MRALLVTLVVLLALTSQVSADTTCVVVRDPQAGYSNSYGWGNGYSYDNDMTNVAIQETEKLLGMKGLTVLLSAGSVGPNQQEIELSNSQWGANGRHQQPKGNFTGADKTYHVSAFVLSSRSTTVGNYYDKSAELGEVEVGVMIKDSSTLTREQAKIYRGSGRAGNVQSVRINLGRGWNPFDLKVSSREDLLRRAVGKAVGAAVNQLPDYHEQEQGFGTANAIEETPQILAEAPIKVNRYEIRLNVADSEVRQKIALADTIRSGDTLIYSRAGQLVCKVVVKDVIRETVKTKIVFSNGTVINGRETVKLFH